ncbi:hypothetical protein PV379_22920 [Streptomyces caniscabiei]|uniref:hypothetical protein n=1 Tax=Streptomyces caniscabiei TaxID=2746961 RepID=UPI0029B471FB|nr:hypothetical protein [Streptomyces caniscabiei]MDX2604278.1 hypothetical protein [Streptomyces caniscabiei]MDX2735620.1 hypothetical protein [Streptomyces caniscabiei]MDX2780147.1 hypothetical protein [Streptomyces caniscabiei]
MRPTLRGSSTSWSPARAPYSTGHPLYGRELGPEGLDAFHNTHAILLDGEPVVTL